MKVFELTMLFIGSIIGAGFATGAEIVTFFDKFALPVWVIALLVGMAMFSIIALSIRLGENSAQPRSALAGIFIILYFVFFVAMTAAVTQLAGVFVSLIALLISGLIVMFSFNKMTRINTFIVIAIIIVLFGICLPHVVMPITTPTNPHHLPGAVVWAFLYAGLNCFMFPELVTAAAPQQKKSTLYLAGLIASVIIAAFVYLILTAIRFTDTQTAVMPLLKISPHPTTFVVILLAILTSQYSSLFAIIQKTQTLPRKHQFTKGHLVLFFATAGFISSFLGFEKILDWGYPLIGAFICGFLFFSWLLYHRPRRSAHR